MKKILAVVLSAIIVVSLLIAGVIFLREPAAPAGETSTNLTIVKTPEQAGAEWPSIFPDPKQNWVKLPESANVAAGKPVSSGEFTEVYAATNVTDGDLTSYWESKGMPAELIIDLEATRTVQTVAVRLNPAPIWEPRTQGFEILVSLDGESFVSVAPNERYEFNSESGNIARIDFEPTSARFVKLSFTEKSSGRSNGGQASEVEIYE